MERDADGVREPARFPTWGRDEGRYESFYLKASDPGTRRAVWIRYTVFKRPGEDPVGSTWVSLFDASWERPAAWKASTPSIGAAPGEYLHVGDAVLAPGRATGPTWDLTFEGDAPTFRYLPYDRLYRAPLPRTKPVDLYPAVRVSGRVAVGDRALELDGWPGMIGHNWGAEHAERWIWVHGTAFEEAPDAIFDAVLGRIKVGPVMVPWVANGLLELDGRRIRLGGLPAVRGTKVLDERAGHVEMTIPGEGGVKVSATFDAPLSETVAWIYSDPPGGEHHSLHTSTADLVLRVDGRTLTLRGGAAYELGLRPAPHGVPVEAFPDP